MKFLTICTLLSFTLLGTSCTKKEESKEETTPAVQSTGTSNQISLSSVGETMSYDKNDLTVKSGENITLTFKNNSSTLQHNWVLTKPGTENDVGMAGIKAGPTKSFITDDPAVAPDILAHTALVNPGQSDTLTFKAPPTGDYPFICTNAGHHTVMKGVLHSK